MLCALYLMTLRPDGFSEQDLFQARVIMQRLAALPKYDFMKCNTGKFETPATIRTYVELSSFSARAFYLAHSATRLKLWNSMSAEGQAWLQFRVDDQPAVRELLPDVPKPLVDDVDFLPFRMSFLYFLMFEDPSQQYNNPWRMTRRGLELKPTRYDLLLGFPAHVASIPSLGKLLLLRKRVL